MLKLILGAAVLLFVAPGPSSAYDVNATPPLRSSGYVPYITGGVGVDERDALLAATKDYGLKLVFAEKQETAFLTDVTVRIATSRGEQVMLMKEMGPYLFVKLAPGNYTITASSRERVLEQSTRVSAGRQVDAAFYW